MKQRNTREASRSVRQAKTDRLYGEKLSFAATEAYKLLRTNLFFCLPEEEERACPVVGITSSIQGEGKSTTAINLAYMLAESGKKVCLIEGDMRAPTFKSRLKLQNKGGLSHVLAGMKSNSQEILGFVVTHAESAKGRYGKKKYGYGYGYGYRSRSDESGK